MNLASGTAGLCNHSREEKTDALNILNERVTSTIKSWCDLVKAHEHSSIRLSQGRPLVQLVALWAELPAFFTEPHCSLKSLLTENLWSVRHGHLQTFFWQRTKWASRCKNNWECWLVGEKVGAFKHSLGFCNAHICWQLPNTFLIKSGTWQ